MQHVYIYIYIHTHTHNVYIYIYIISYIHIYHMYTYISHTHTYIYISYTHITCRHISVWYTYIHKSLLWRLFFWQQDWLCTQPRRCLQHFKTDILPKGIQNYYQIHPRQSFMVAVSIPTAFLSSFGVISHSLNSHFRERQRKGKEKRMPNKQKTT